MAITQNTFTGDGSTTNFSFTFEYIKESDVKASLDGTSTTAFTLANATTLSFTTAPANGVAIRIFRDTAIDSLKATFFPGSAIKAEDLNDNFTQNNFAVQETDFDVATANTTADAAKTAADSAVATANTASTDASAAVSTANTASTNASAAVTTANTASTNASNAVTTANSAATDAAAAVSTANTASTNASAAVTTANTASTNASNAVTTANSASTTATSAATDASNAVSTANTASTTANTASTNASNAVSTANAASSAVANAILYDPVANVSSIPGSPSDGDYIEVQDSTGIQSFSPLTGLPSGFTGSSGLTVRLKYVTSPSSTWQWQNYFANDSESRYLKPADADTSYVGKTSSTGSAELPAGTTAQRDGSPSAGYIRFNSTVSQFEGYNGTSWASVGGGATGGGSDQWAIEHDNTITTSYAIGTGKNVISAGPLTVNSGATVTVPSGSNWTIV